MILREIQLTAKEAERLRKLLLKHKGARSVALRQSSSSGIGLALKLVIIEPDGSLKHEDITDYSTW